MLKLGLTGGIATGKSAVAQMFAQLGAHVMESDAVAHELMQPGRPVYEEILRSFGNSVLKPDRTINRAKLAEVAFGKTGSSATPRVQELNAIVHPAVIQRENEWMSEIDARDPNAIAIVVAALILEAHAGDRFDRLIVVTCRPEQRIQRFAKRHGISEDAALAEVTRRLAAQMPDEEKIKAADFVIDNSGTLESTREQVKKVFAALRNPD